MTTTTQEAGSRMVTDRISNKQILEALVEAGVITNITGYSIALYTGDNEGGAAFYLIKKDTPPKNISQYLYPDSEEDEPEAEAYRETRVSTTNSSSEAPPTVIRHTISENGKHAVSIHFRTAQTNVEMYGISNYSENLRTFGTGSSRRTVIMPNAGSVTNIIGSAENIEPAVSPEASVSASAEESQEENEASLIEGRINLAPGVLLPLAS